MLLSIDIEPSKLACIGHILKGKVSLVLYIDRAMAGLYDRAMADILQKLEKATRGSRGGLDS